MLTSALSLCEVSKLINYAFYKFIFIFFSFTQTMALNSFLLSEKVERKWCNSCRHVVVCRVVVRIISRILAVSIVATVTVAIVIVAIVVSPSSSLVRVAVTIDSCCVSFQRFHQLCCLLLQFRRCYSSGTTDDKAKSTNCH
jgi:hypothetical protein